ncbi:hypothetical protein B7P43_G02679 [Cryptotermes secundus]|uniref:Uncharacterized protein n=1 Tax=Cryptotermes secundus TaxID=105785 RepID=A0A2J7QCD7_9NEOP|nr:hypothetical protein B7P43_G02679 [Cryptotermes secundus]
MADEDEVDVLGDFNFDNLFSKDDGRLASCYDGSVLGSQGAELLHCDYGITQQWLLEAATQPCWDSGSDDTKAPHTDDRQQYGFSTPLSTTDPSSASPNWIDNDSWSDKEKGLLEKGLDLFGHSWGRLSQFIGTKSSHQVKTYVRSHLHHFGPADENGAQASFSSGSGCCSAGAVGFTELIDDMQIPASMEEVIAVVSTAQPTIPSVPRRNIVAGATTSQSNNVLNSGESKKKVNVHNESVREKSRRGRPQVVSKLHATKRPSKVNRNPSRKPGFRSNAQGSNIKTYQTGKLKRQTGVHVKDFIQKDSCSVTSIHRGGIILSAGEEVVRIQKESSHDSDEDGEIEIEERVDDVNVLCLSADIHTSSSNMDVVASTTSEALSNENRLPLTEFQSDHLNTMDIRSLSGVETHETKVESTEERGCREDTHISEEQSENTQSLALRSKEKNFKPDLKPGTSEISPPKDCSDGREGGKGSSLASSHQDILESIFSLPPPTEDIMLDAKTITEEEKIIHAEFFEGRSAKTPKRYLKIRNHILECWRHSRPTYVTKTSVRTGLKNCGDVNCIGRIHAYLEQIGAINFGCVLYRASPLHTPFVPDVQFWRL